VSDDILKAEQIIFQLLEKKKEHLAKGKHLSQLRQEVSFSAHTGDSKARRRLDELISEIVRHDAELVSIDAAIQEAKARLVAAQAAAVAEADRQKALALRALLLQFCAQGERIDALLAEIATVSDEMTEVINKIHALGEPRPTHHQLTALGSIAVRTALQRTPWFEELAHVGPLERRTFASLIDGWCAGIERDSIAPRLNEKEEKVAA
jgi:hypothetical protein